MGSYIKAIGTANPGQPIPQKSIASFMVKAHGLEGQEQSKLEALFRSTGISSRYSVISDYSGNGQRNFFPKTNNLEPFPSTKMRMDLFRNKAVDLSLRAVYDCLGNKFQLNQITNLITVSCTGMYAPGLDIDLVTQLGLPSTTSRSAINYMGCYAAINALRIADSICKSDVAAKVLVVCVELCSIHFQKVNSEDNYLANSIFGDGAAAVLISSGMTKEMDLELLSFYSDILDYGKEEMAWTIDDFGFQMKLSSYVPDVIRKGIAELTYRFLSGNNLELKDIDFFAIHPGGKRILDEIESELGMEKSKNQYAREVLKNYGNMSSPTVLFVVKSLLSIIKKNDKGKIILVMAFGPGLTIETVLLRVV
jgi:predicted naringenin-chalcone synthase